MAIAEKDGVLVQVKTFSGERTHALVAGDVVNLMTPKTTFTVGKYTLVRLTQVLEPHNLNGNSEVPPTYIYVGDAANPDKGMEGMPPQKAVDMVMAELMPKGLKAPELKKRREQIAAQVSNLLMWLWQNEITAEVSLKKVRFLKEGK